MTLIIAGPALSCVKNACRVTIIQSKVSIRAHYYSTILVGFKWNDTFSSLTGVFFFIHSRSYNIIIRTVII